MGLDILLHRMGPALVRVDPAAALVLPGQIGRVAAGDLRGQLGPIVAPGDAGFDLHLHVGVALFEEALDKGDELVDLPLALPGNNAEGSADVRVHEARGPAINKNLGIRGLVGRCRPRRRAGRQAGREAGNAHEAQPVPPGHLQTGFPFLHLDQLPCWIDSEQKTNWVARVRPRPSGPKSRCRARSTSAR